MALQHTDHAAPFQSSEGIFTIPPARRGKVREVYEMTPGADARPSDPSMVLIVASDRISAYDVVLPTLIPGKGRVLNEIATWWFRFVQEHRLVETHLISTDPDDLPDHLWAGGPEDAAASKERLRGRITIGRQCRVIPIECVVRGYLEGTGWKDYLATGEVCGHKLPKGLKRCQQLPEPLFTPATKAETGHDENISFEQAADIVGLETMGILRDLSLRIYNAAAAYALSRGIIIADTKFEFGLPEDAVSRVGRAWQQPILIDEALTPDSSRFWPASTYEPGRPQPSFDKQFVREFLEQLVSAGKWDKTPPGPVLPAEVVEGTMARYIEARDRLCT